MRWSRSEGPGWRRARGERLVSELAQLDGLAALLFALLGGVEEGEDLEGFFGVDRGLAGLEEFDDRLDHRHVGILELGGGLEDLVVFGEDYRAKFGIGAEGADRADAAVGPAAGDLVLIGGGDAGDRFAAAAEDREQHLGGVDGIPAELKIVVLVERARTPDRGALEAGLDHRSEAGGPAET